jgi:hypothetical protein
LLLAAVGGCGSPSAVVPTNEQVRACATATACAIMNDFDGCIRYFGNVAETVAHTGTATFGPADIACLARAGSDCDAAQRCVNGGAAAQSCSGSAAACDGNIARGCFSGMTRAFDCASVGLRCIASASGSAACGADGCAPDGTSCDLAGATLYDCVDGVQRQVDCTRDGAACVFVGPVASCIGVGHTCATNTLCDGDVIVSCASGRQQRLDCGARGLHCIVNYRPTPFFECGNGTTCDTASKASCDGAGQLHYCYLGTPLVADCLASGFSGCAATGCVR